MVEIDYEINEIAFVSLLTWPDLILGAREYEYDMHTQYLHYAGLINI